MLHFRRPVFFLLCIVLGIASCNQQPTTQGNESATPNQPTAQAPSTYSKLPLDRVNRLRTSCTATDIVFYEFDFSANQTDAAGIQVTIAGIEDQSPNIQPSCKPIGRIFFNAGGSTLEQADIYIDNSCFYYIFLEDDQPAYANVINQQGLALYARIFSQFVPQE